MQALRELAADDVDGAIERLAKLPPRVSLLALKTSLLHKQFRAPSRENQLYFFSWARERVHLGRNDEILYRVALCYVAIEAGNQRIATECLMVFENLQQYLIRHRARLDLPIVSPKRGHHLYFSVALAQIHGAIAFTDNDLFLRAVNQSCFFFDTVTQKARDKGFGFAVTNAVRVAGFGFLYWTLRRDHEAAILKLRSMHAMIRLAVTRRVGKMEYHGLAAAFRWVDLAERLSRDYSAEAAKDFFMAVGRLRPYSENLNAFIQFGQMINKSPETR